MSVNRGWAPDSPLFSVQSPKATAYSQEQCEEDAQHSGLDAHALRLHVETTLDARTGLRDDQLDNFLRAHRISRPDGMSRLDKARILAGVPPQYVAPGHTSQIPSPVGRSPASSPQAAAVRADKVAIPRLLCCMLNFSSVAALCCRDAL